MPREMPKRAIAVASLGGAMALFGLYRAKHAGRNRVVCATGAEPADARAHA